MPTLLIDGVSVDVRDLVCVPASDGSLAQIRFTIDSSADRELFNLHLPVRIAVSGGYDAGAKLFRLTRFELGQQHTIYVFVKHA